MTAFGSLWDPSRARYLKRHSEGGNGGGRCGKLTQAEKTEIATYFPGGIIQDRSPAEARELLRESREITSATADPSSFRLKIINRPDGRIDILVAGPSINFLESTLHRTVQSHAAAGTQIAAQETLIHSGSESRHMAFCFMEVTGHVNSALPVSLDQAIKLQGRMIGDYANGLMLSLARHVLDRIDQRKLGLLPGPFKGDLISLVQHGLVLEGALRLTRSSAGFDVDQKARLGITAVDTPEMRALIHALEACSSNLDPDLASMDLVKLGVASPVHEQRPLVAVIYNLPGSESSPGEVFAFIGLLARKFRAKDLSSPDMLGNTFEDLVRNNTWAASPNTERLARSVWRDLPKDFALRQIANVPTVVNAVLGMHTSISGERKVLFFDDRLSAGLDIVVCMPQHRDSAESQEAVANYVAKTFGLKRESLEIRGTGNEGNYTNFYIWVPHDLFNNPARNALQAQLTEDISELTAAWGDRLAAITREINPEESQSLLHRYADAFAHGPFGASLDLNVRREEDAKVKQDILAIERFGSKDSVKISFESALREGEGRNLVIYSKRPLNSDTEILPSVRNAGFKFEGNLETYSIKPAGSEQGYYVYRRAVKSELKSPPAEDTLATVVAPGLERLLSLSAETNPFNTKLATLLQSGLSLRQISLLTSSSELLSIKSVALRVSEIKEGDRTQIITRDKAAIYDALAGNPELARKLYQMSEVLNDENEEVAKRESAAKAIRAEILKKARTVNETQKIWVEDLCEVIEHTTRAVYDADSGRYALKIIRQNEKDAPHNFSQNLNWLPAEASYVYIVLTANTRFIQFKADLIAGGGLRDWIGVDYSAEALKLEVNQEQKNIGPEHGQKGCMVCTRRTAATSQEELKQLRAESVNEIVPGVLSILDDKEITTAQIIKRFTRDNADYIFRFGPDIGTSDLMGLINDIAEGTGHYLGVMRCLASSDPRTGLSHPETGITSLCAKPHSDLALLRKGIDPNLPYIVFWQGGISNAIDVISNSSRHGGVNQVWCCGSDHEVFIFSNPPDGWDSKDPETLARVAPKLKAQHAERERLRTSTSTLNLKDFDRTLLEPGSFIVPLSDSLVELSDEFCRMFNLEPGTSMSPRQLQQLRNRGWNGKSLFIIGGKGDCIVSQVGAGELSSACPAAEVEHAVVLEIGNNQVESAAMSEMNRRGVAGGPSSKRNGGGVSGSGQDMGGKYAFDKPLARGDVTREVVFAEDVARNPAKVIKVLESHQVSTLSDESQLWRAKRDLRLHNGQIRHLENSAGLKRKNWGIESDAEQTSYGYVTEHQLSVAIYAEIRLLRDRLIELGYTRNKELFPFLKQFYPEATFALGEDLFHSPYHDMISGSTTAKAVVESLGSGFLTKLTASGLVGETAALNAAISSELILDTNCARLKLSQSALAMVAPQGEGKSAHPITGEARVSWDDFMDASAHLMEASRQLTTFMADYHGERLDLSALTGMYRARISDAVSILADRLPQDIRDLVESREQIYLRSGISPDQARILAMPDLTFVCEFALSEQKLIDAPSNTAKNVDSSRLADIFSAVLGSTGAHLVYEAAERVALDNPADDTQMNVNLRGVRQRLELLIRNIYYATVHLSGAGEASRQEEIATLLAGTGQALKSLKDVGQRILDGQEPAAADFAIFGELIRAVAHHKSLQRPPA